jgi:hypothetical protein
MAEAPPTTQDTQDNSPLVDLAVYLGQVRDRGLEPLRKYWTWHFYI